MGKISWKQVVAPFVGAAVAWLATKGVNLTPDQQTAFVGLVASAAGAATHIIEMRLQKIAASNVIKK